MSTKNVVDLPNGKETQTIETVAAIKRDIPLHVLTNIQQFMQRVKMDGMEAYGYVEAMGFIQEKIQEAQAAGVPFLGLPLK